MNLDKLVVNGEEPGPHLLITAGVHGDEYEPMETVRRVFKIVEAVQSKLKGTLTLVPVVNQPAFKLAERTGADKLDLARICPGKEEGSESEQIAYAVSTLIKTADYYIDMHNGGRYHNIFPFSGYVLHSDESVLESQRQLAKAFLLPIIWGTDPGLQGRTLSVARDANIPAIYTEIGGAGIYQESNTVLAVEGCINVLKFLGMLPGKAKDSNISYHLEDHRKESGHLQRLLPSPTDGFYMPVVSFGQEVKEGEIIGYVQDVLGQSRTPIKADQSGIIFILRSVASVQKGDALGAILPVRQNNKLQSIYE
ncbi:MAG: succinylglutamate desuccinylase/aspartoacylase family protein [Saprospiraceae bacterium]|nr:succinylglutamate desuccinylase/aspartoacylase family protein [Saprospiraceae bacterium]